MQGNLFASTHLHLKTASILLQQSFAAHVALMMATSVVWLIELRIYVPERVISETFSPADLLA